MHNLNYTKGKTTGEECCLLIIDDELIIVAARGHQLRLPRGLQPARTRNPHQELLAGGRHGHRLAAQDESGRARAPQLRLRGRRRAGRAPLHPQGQGAAGLPG